MTEDDAVRRLFGVINLINIAVQNIDGRYLVEALRTNRSIYCDDAKSVAKVVREMLESMVAGGVQGK